MSVLVISKIGHILSSIMIDPDFRIVQDLAIRLKGIDDRQLSYPISVVRPYGFNFENCLFSREFDREALISLIASLCQRKEITETKQVKKN